LNRCFIPASFRDEVSGDRIKKLMEILKYHCFDRRYLEFVSHWKSPANVVLGGHEPPTAMTSGRIPAALGAVERMMYLDTVAYLPDDILLKVDRAAMAVGLEIRSPLLDHRVVEAAWRAPRTLCLAGDQGKIALRRLLARRMPEHLFDRPKQGFGVPINDWLRGPLRSWAAESLSPDRLQPDGWFCPATIEAHWQQHLSGIRNWGPHLWTILMFNAWHDRWAGSH
jgi:asparagine synthase (glutamine-hydrolysing)